MKSTERSLRVCTGLFGAMDACAGVGLIFAPGWTLSLLGITPPELSAIVYLRWIGVFVGCVGAVTGVAAFRARAHWVAALEITTAIRWAVAIFCAASVAMQVLPLVWGSVALTDFLVGVAQAWIARHLRAGRTGP